MSPHRSNCVHVERWSCSTIVFLLVEASCDPGRTFQYATISLTRSLINIDINCHCGPDPKYMANGFAVFFCKRRDASFGAKMQLRALSELSLSPAFQSPLSPSSPLYIITTTGTTIIIMQLKLCLIACSICHPHHFHQNPPKTSLSPLSSSSSLSTRSNW